MNNLCIHVLDYNIPRAMRIAELERWFFATFQFWLTNPIGLIIVPKGSVERISTFQGMDIVGFHVEKASDPEDNEMIRPEQHLLAEEKLCLELLEEMAQGKQYQELMQPASLV
uniref:Uncharacterized protein n=1 Tax=Romanomermis culicivorax TaxID=13658 RepID=A0A915I9E0_ROMCU